MSSHHQVSLVQVNAFREEIVELSKVFGRVPVQQIKEVLDSAWARKVGWARLGNGNIYSLNLRHNIVMEVAFDEFDEITISRKVSGFVDRERQHEHSLQLEKWITEVEPEYNLRFNEIVGKAFMVALPEYASEFGEVVECKERYEEEAHVFDMELKIYVREAA